MVNKKEVRKIIEYKFRMAEIVTQEFCYSNISKKISNRIVEHTIMRMNYKMSPNMKKNQIIFLIGMVLSEKISNVMICKLQVRFTFDVQELDKLIKGENFINEQIPMQFASLSYSTFRGLLFEKLSGTPFSKLPPIPAVAPSTLLSSSSIKEKNPSK